MRPVIRTSDDGRFTVRAYEIDLQRYRPVVADARREGREGASVQTLVVEHGAHLGVNGGFFDPQRRPLGLLVRDGKILNRLRKADWGVLFVKKRGRRAQLVHTREFSTRRARRAAFAIQVGPRLVVKGAPVGLKPQIARRTFIGLRDHGRTLIVGVTEGRAVESNELARLVAAPVAEGGLACHDALMLDGGPSTQLFAAVGDHVVNLPGAYDVPNAVVFMTHTSK